MLKIRQLCVTSLLLVSGVASAANVRLQVEGLSGELEKNVRAQLSTIQSDEVTPDRRFRARVDDAIREGLKALGYYEPTIEFDLRPPPKRGRQVLIAKVTPGEPVRIGGTEVILRGGARTDSDYGAAENAPGHRDGAQPRGLRRLQELADPRRPAQRLL